MGTRDNTTAKGETMKTKKQNISEYTCTELENYYLYTIKYTDSMKIKSGILSVIEHEIQSRFGVDALDDFLSEAIGV